ncbi:hypothetical protein DTO271D3_7159 [Paecilomyces variotii]|nr:hypothetical protein DTO271D3_7159 [Paecilomyces variotii]
MATTTFRNTSNENGSSACTPSFPELAKMDGWELTHRMEQTTTEDLWARFPQEDDLLTWSTVPRTKFLQIKKHLHAIRGLYPKVKKLLHRMPDPNYAKVAFSVARLQEHVRDVETANRNMAVHVDELEITLCHERRRFQQELESQRKTFQEREQCLIDQLLFDGEIRLSEDS